MVMSFIFFYQDVIVAVKMFDWLGFSIKLPKMSFEIYIASYENGYQT